MAFRVHIQSYGCEKKNRKILRGISPRPWEQNFCRRDQFFDDAKIFRKLDRAGVIDFVKKIVKIGAILAIFRPFEDFGDFRFDRFDIFFDSIDTEPNDRWGPPCKQKHVYPGALAPGAGMIRRSWP